jgi:hypothetical protein
MTEYAVMRDGKIVNCVTSSMPIDQLRERYEGYQVVPLSEASQAARESYEFWHTRP